MTTQAPTAFYCRLTLNQDGVVFRSSHDLTIAVKGHPTEEETIAYITDGLDGCLEDDADEGNTIDLKGMTPVEFATKLVNDEKFSIDELGTEWEIYTNFQEADADNWNNPLS